MSLLETLSRHLSPAPTPDEEAAWQAEMAADYRNMVGMDLPEAERHDLIRRHAKSALPL